jgi:hypothetical protein
MGQALGTAIRRKLHDERVVTESGTLIAHDGKLEKTLDGTGEVVEVLYTINGNTLVTSGADGSTVVWRQENATPAHSKSSHPLDSKTHQTCPAVSRTSRWLLAKPPEVFPVIHNVRMSVL